MCKSVAKSTTEGKGILYGSGLINLEFILPLCNACGQSSTGGVWISNGLAPGTFLKLFL